MADEELAGLIARFAETEPRTKAGVDAVFTLAAHLANEPEFSGGPRMVVSARGSHGFHTDFAAQRMLGIMRTTRDPFAAIAWLRKVSSITQATGGAVKALYGVKCEGRVQISENVVLLPILELPASQTRDWILEEHERANELGGLHGVTLPPASALYRAGTVTPLFIKPSAVFEPSHISPWFDELDQAAQLLALTPHAVPIECAHWMHYEDADIALVGQWGIGRAIPEVQPTGLVEPPLVTAESTVGLVPATRRLKKHDKDRIYLALSRLIRSRCQRHPGNRAIDLAIALEVLFMNAEGEHSHKISVRAARMLRGDLEQRRTLSIEVKRLYELRSQMVHTGSAANDFPVNGVRRTAYDLVETADVTCMESVRTMLGRGGIPEDWRDIDLA